jgi:hypothetical protein
MEKLKLLDKYSREQIHNIFSPGTKFTRGVGWGASGILSVPNKEDDFVFISSNKGNSYNDYISSSGVLSWSTQDRQHPKTKQVIKFIKHDSYTNKIHFFFRFKDNEKYTYYGLLGYLWHNEYSENPTKFEWRLLDWENIKDKINTSNFKSGINNYKSSERKGKLIESNVNLDDLFNNGNRTKKPKKPKKPKAKNSNSSPNWNELNKENKILGDKGEEFVLKHQKKKLIEIGREDLSKKVEHTSKVKGDGEGYDILSFNDKGEELYIEVKTTKASLKSQFFMSRNEYKVYQSNIDKYVIARVYDFVEDESGTVLYINGEDISKFNFETHNYVVTF